MTQPPIFQRGPREKHHLPTGQVKLEEPNPPPPEPKVSWLSLVLPPALTIAVMTVVFVVGSQLASSQMLMLSLAISMPLMLIGYLVSFLNHFTQKRAYKAQIKERTNRYASYLANERVKLEKWQQKTLAILSLQHPDPESCIGIARKQEPGQLWARDPGDSDFLEFRLGLGAASFQIEIEPPKQRVLDPDPLVDDALALAKEFSTIDNVPITFSLPDVGILGLVGSRSHLLEVMRSLIIQLATHHSPLDVRLVVIFPSSETQKWAWMRWLPHVWSDPNDRERRYLACDRNAAHNLLDEMSEILKPTTQAIEQGQDKGTRQGGPTYLFVIADPELAKGHPLMASLVNFSQQLRAYSFLFAANITQLPSKCGTFVQQSVRDVASFERQSQGLSYVPDQIALESGDSFSRLLAPLRIQDPQISKEPPRVVTLMDILNVKRMQDLDVLDNWQNNNPFRSMSVPIGKGPGGKLQYLDLHDDRGLKRSQRFGHGPHGLGAGIVGSGKGVLIQSIVASLSANFHPHKLNFLLLDFKEGATSKPLLGLPHVVNEITNREKTIIPRVLLSIRAEYDRRAALIRGKGYEHIDDYMKLYDQGKVDEILPYLIIIIDEFKMLLDEFPELADAFIEMAVKGRWAGLLLMLFNQQLSGVVSPFIERNAEYRLCLRVANAEESRTILGNAKAEELAGKGQAILQVKTEQGSRIDMKFQSAWSTAPYFPQEDTDSQVIFEVALDGRRQKTTREAPTQLSVFIEYVAEQAGIAGIKPFRPVWLDSLPTQFALDSEIENEVVRIQSGWDGANWQSVQRWLRPIIGLQDDPENQQRLPLQPNLSHSGHLLICSNQAEQNRLILRTLVMSLVLDHTPKELNIYCLDLGSFGLQVFKDLFHVGAVIQPNEPRRIQRLFRFLMTQLESRKNWLAQNGLPNLAVAHHQQATDCPPALVIVIDNVSALTSEYETDSLLTLLKEGQGAGIHFVIADVKGSLTSLWKIINVVDRLRIALQLTSREDYAEVLGVKSGDINIMVPDADGRGFCKDGRFLECQVALPIVGQTSHIHKLDKALSTLVKQITQSAQAAGFEKPIQIGSLPSNVILQDLIKIDCVKHWPTVSTNAPLQIPIGIDDLTLRPMIVNLTEDGPHFFITGPKKGGKTTALYTFVLALATMYPKEAVQFIVFDRINGKLASLQMLPHTRHYALYTDTEQMQAVLQELRQEFERRQTAKQERPALVLIADEYDFLKSDALKEPLSDHAQHDTISGFHVILSQSATNLSGWDKFRTAVLSHYSGLVVGSVNLDNDAAVFDYTFPIEQKRDKLIPGRAFLFRHRQPHLVQVATPGDQSDIHEWIERIVAADAKHQPLTETKGKSGRKPGRKKVDR